ncbi:MAG: DNA polymerase I [Anaerolinea sp.]
MAERPTFVLIDGHAVAYRQFYAVRGERGFTTRDGEPTNASYGFSRFLLDVIQTLKPDYLAVSFDQGMGGRDQLYPEYKGTRAAMPDELSAQMNRIQEIVSAFNIPVLELPDAEADDVIGTVARQAEAAGVRTHIITGDRDLLQLLTDHIVVQLPSYKGDDKVYDIPAFRERFQIEPRQFIDFKALVGDSSDNIPGVAGVGDKTAAQLLQTYGTLDGIYEHLDEIKETVRVKLAAGREMAYLSRQLATIQTDLPIQLDLERCVTHDFDVEKVDAIFAQLEFRSIRERLRQTHSLMSAASAAPIVQPLQAQVVIVRTPEQLAQLVAALNAASLISFDTETTDVDPMRAELVGISLAISDQVGYYIPVGHVGENAGTLFAQPAADQLPLETVLDALRPALTNPAIGKVAHNAAYDALVLLNHGLEVTPLVFDTMIAEWVRDPISRFLGLKNFARQELNIEMTDISDLIGSGKKQIPFSQVSIEQAAPYAVADAVVTLKARDYLDARLRDPQINMAKLFYALEMPIVPVVVAMEQAGALLDLDEIERQSRQLTAQMEQREARIYELAGAPFNINSPKQLNDVLFTQLKLSVAGLKKTTQGYSTNINTLDALRDAHPIVPEIIQYRELSKLKSTYLDALPALVNPRTGRVHTSYNQTGTSTGRFSSSNPNLQNIPIRTELGREIRRVFIAPPGMLLLSVDYSQIELRVMAHMSGDETLIQAFHDGQDIHRATAAAVYGVPLAEVTYDQRAFAKRVNFGLMYGMGAFRLARDSDLTLKEAEDFINRYFERLPLVRDYLEQTKAFAIEHGYVQTLFGRKRFFPRLHHRSPTSAEAQADLRAAINAPIQGTAADILKLALLKLHAFIRTQPDVRMTLQVHDELVFEVPEDRAATLAAQIRQIMQEALIDNPIQPVEFAVPLQANAEYGTNWLEMQPLA